MKLLPRLPAYETQDVPPVAIVVTMVGLFLVVGMSLVIVAGLVLWMHPTELQVSPIETEQLRAGPRLEVDPAQNARQLQTAAAQRLQGYAWTDRNAQEAHIPIDRAIALLARQGWPDADQPESKP